MFLQHICLWSELQCKSLLRCDQDDLFFPFPVSGERSNYLWIKEMCQEVVWRFQTYLLLVLRDWLRVKEKYLSPIWTLGLLHGCTVANVFICPFCVNDQMSNLLLKNGVERPTALICSDCPDFSTKSPTSQETPRQTEKVGHSRYLRQMYLLWTWDCEWGYAQVQGGIKAWIGQKYTVLGPNPERLLLWFSSSENSKIIKICPPRIKKSL